MEGTFHKFLKKEVIAYLSKKNEYEREQYFLEQELKLDNGKIVDVGGWHFEYMGGKKYVTDVFIEVKTSVTDLRSKNGLNFDEEGENYLVCPESMKESQCFGNILDIIPGYVEIIVFNYDGEFRSVGNGTNFDYRCKICKSRNVCNCNDCDLFTRWGNENDNNR